MAAVTTTIEALTNQKYQYGFVTDIEAEFVPLAPLEVASRMQYTAL